MTPDDSRFGHREEASMAIGRSTRVGKGSPHGPHRYTNAVYEMTHSTAIPVQWEVRRGGGCLTPKATSRCPLRISRCRQGVSPVILKAVGPIPGTHDFLRLPDAAEHDSTARSGRVYHRLKRAGAAPSASFANLYHIQPGDHRR